MVSLREKLEAELLSGTMYSFLGRQLYFWTTVELVHHLCNHAARSRCRPRRTMGFEADKCKWPSRGGVSSKVKWKHMC